MTKQKQSIVWILIVSVAAIAAAIWMFWEPHRETVPLKVGISPYQDIAMLVNYEHLGLEDKYGTQLELVTLAWEDILPAVASSASDSLDVGFGSLTEYLTKYDRLNVDSDDPIVFVYPLYVYKGGGFVALDENVTALSTETIGDRAAVQQFLTHHFGAQSQSIYEMVLFSLARRSGVPPKDLEISDMSMNDALLATENGSIDVAAAGLTQITEATRRGGRVVLSMDDAGFADITGFICRRSVLDSRRKEIEDLIRMWFDCVGYVTADLESNAEYSLAYLRKNSATRYTFEEYRTALAQEYLPASLNEARQQLIDPQGKYPLQRISEDVAQYLVAQGMSTERPPAPKPMPVE